MCGPHSDRIYEYVLVHILTGGGGGRLYHHTKSVVLCPGVCVLMSWLCVQAPPRPDGVLQRGVAVALRAGAGRLRPAPSRAALRPLPAGGDTGQEP